jgi:hypothetical protein
MFSLSILIGVRGKRRVITWHYPQLIKCRMLDASSSAINDSSRR